MSDAVSPVKKQEARILKRQALLLWQTVTTTQGVADLADPLKRVEHYFERLTKGQRTTVAVIAKKLAEGFHAIETEERKVTAEEKPQVVESEVVEPDQVIPPNQDDIGDGSGTGD